MGYVPPPSGFLTLPKGVTYTAAEAIREDLSSQLATLYSIYATPQMVLRHHRATSYEQYRRDLYGEPGIDWMPFLRGALLVSVIALIAAIAWAVT